MRNLSVKALLEDRFHLKVHRETKEGPVYDLVVAKGGIKFQHSKEGNCVAVDHFSRPFHLLLASDFERTVIDKTGLVGSGQGSRGAFGYR